MTLVRFSGAFGALGLLILNGCSGGGSSATTAPVVVPQNPTIQWATPAAVVAGTALGSTQLNATATTSGSATALAGTFVYTPAAGTVLSIPGTQTLSVLFTPADLLHYNTGSSSVSLTVTQAPAPSYSWNNVQIVGGGYVTGIVMHPAQQGLMYARTDVGGAYRWNSTAKLWIPLTDWVTRATSNYIGIESIGLDPADPQRLYLAVGTYTESFGSNGAMLLSSDQGATFTTVPLLIKLGSNDNGRNAGERLGVDPNLGSVIYFGSRLNGLWRSTDRGLTWSQVSSFPVTTATSGVGVVFVDFIKSSSSAGSATKTIYAGVSAKGTGTDPQSLYVSNDAGVTWSAVVGAPIGMYVTHGVQGSDGSLYFTFGDAIGPNSLSSGAVYQYFLPTSSNPAGVWNTITPPRSNGYQGGYGAVTLDPQRPGVIMVSTLDHYYPVGDDLWRSLDYGKTWYSINTVGALRDVSLSPWDSFGAASVVNTGNWVGSMQIDPFDSTHVVYGNGQTVFTTSNITASDTGQPSNWTIGAKGLEETVVLALMSPPSGAANLFSGVGDLGGFRHTDLAKSPSTGALSNPRLGNGTSLDFAESNPAIVARVGSGSNSQFGGYSADGGATWTPFTSNPAGTVNGNGTIAVSANGSMLVWAPGDAGAATSYSTDQGKTWKPSTSATANQQVIADRINPTVFYVFDTKAGSLLTSTDGGVTFAPTQTGLPTGGSLRAIYDAEGDLWLASGSGLYHGSKGVPLAKVASVTSAWGISAGMAVGGSARPTLFLGGQVGSQPGVYRSVDAGATWVRIDDAAHEYGYVNVIQGDPRVFGRVYLGTSGRGIAYGDSPN